jgi:hypothetical protein
MAAITIPAEATLWRARLGGVEIEGELRPYADVGPPPPRQPSDDPIRPGRLNRENEILFYGADQEDTAVAEMRPYRGAVVSVGPFRPVRPLRVIDLTADLPPVNPFTEESLLYWEEFYQLLTVIGGQMAKPLERDDDKRDYIPCQRIGQRLRELGYDGVRYPSAMRENGTNLGLFDVGAVQASGDPRLVQVCDVQIRYEPYTGTRWVIY